jgi:hypothetical protein
MIRSLPSRVMLIVRGAGQRGRRAEDHLVPPAAQGRDLVAHRHPVGGLVVAVHLVDHAADVGGPRRDIGAALGIGAARGSDLAVLAELLPAAEAGLIEALHASEGAGTSARSQGSVEWPLVSASCRVIGRRACTPDLVRVVQRTIQLTTQDFRVQEGLRTRERHAELVARGVSRTMNSLSGPTATRPLSGQGGL